MDKLLKIVEEAAFKELFVMVPEIASESWFKKLDDAADSHHGIEPSDKVNVWTDFAGRPIRTETLTWFLMRFTSQ